MLIKRYVKINAIGAKWERITKQWDRKTHHLFRVDLPSSRRNPGMWIPALENAGN